MKTDLGRVRGLLTEAITMLCKSSLVYRAEFSIEGLLGITLDNNEVFLVNINEKVQELKLGTKRAHDKHTSNAEDSSCPNSPGRGKRARRSRSNSPTLAIEEPVELSVDGLREISPQSDDTLENIPVKPEIPPDIAKPQSQSVDFGDLMASYETAPDLGSSYNDTNVKSETINDTVTNATQRPNTEDDDIVIVKEEKSDAAAAQAAAAAIGYPTPGATQQFDYYSQQTYTQGQNFQNEYNPQTAGPSYEQWPNVGQSNVKQAPMRTPQKQRTPSTNRASPKVSANRNPQQRLGQAWNLKIETTGVTPPMLQSTKSEDLIAMGTTTTYTCSFCNNTYPTAERLKYHIKCKHGAPSYSCNHCGQSFKWQNSLQRHRTKYHSSAESNETGPEGLMYDGSGTPLRGSLSLSLPYREGGGSKQSECDK